MAAEALAPRWWPTWVLVGVLAALGRLPRVLRWTLGRGLGHVLRAALGRRRRIAAANLALCFPWLDVSARGRLLREHFEELGVGVLDSAAAWVQPARALDRIARLRGLEHVDAALARGHGAIVVAAHCTSLDMSMQLVARRRRAYAIYRANKNLVLDRVVLRGRSRHGATLFEREDMRTLLGALRANEVVWFSPDQDHGIAHGAFVRFFGQPAATVTTTARIAERTGAAVLPLLYRRVPERGGYELEVLPALAEFPGADPLRATRTINRIFERQVHLAPAQYLWVHRRFKTRPAHLAAVYDR